MKRLLALASVVMFVACSGCGDSHESLAEDGLSAMKEMVATLDGIKDEASAKSAKSKLKAQVEELKDINERQGKLGMPSEAEFEAMEAKYGKEMEALRERLVSNMLRIGFDPKIRAVLDDIDMKNVG